MKLETANYFNDNRTTTSIFVWNLMELPAWPEWYNRPNLMSMLRPISNSALFRAFDDDDGVD